MRFFEKDRFTVLFDGDSITHGGRLLSMDCNHILGHGYQNLISTKLGMAFMDKMPKFINKGVSGQGLWELYGRIFSHVIPYEPDLISILVGINDSGKAPEDLLLNSWEDLYRMTVSDLHKALPEAEIVLTEPFFLPMPKRDDPYAFVPHKRSEADFPCPMLGREEEMKGRRKTVEEMQKIVARIAEEEGTALVRVQEKLDALALKVHPSYLSWDGVHPTAIGHGVLAEEWWKTVMGGSLFG
ncbi:MAG: GDSL-type esterase/lipase family protein [Clostridia bacterium]|nr:GDSL-type esterase/lipase family protein [Clostridia bacterium]